MHERAGAVRWAAPAQLSLVSVEREGIGLVLDGDGSVKKEGDAEGKERVGLDRVGAGRAGRQGFCACSATPCHFLLPPRCTVLNYFFLPNFVYCFLRYYGGTGFFFGRR